MGSNLYPQLCRILKDAGCTFVRQAKGSHEIWFSPISHRNITIPKNTRVIHTANKVLKDAGLPKAF
jgi:predicted RNA binding protein YcfA (HicA-like mRNA interferase family)